MSREERGGLLHEGAGSAVVNAHLRNADQRFATDTPEVILRRTIGQKKDEYSLNRKNTARHEVMNMLETAGFSTSDPYYIVPQGRITAITNMPDAERLDILKEVAGTKVYEERRAASQKIIDNTEHRRAKIDSMSCWIIYVDGWRGCLEYTIYHKDQEALQEALEKLEEERECGVKQTDDDREALQRSEFELEKIDAEISELYSQIKLLSEERAQPEDERKDTAKQKAKIELDVQPTTDNQLQEQIAEREAELPQLLPEYTAKKELERALRQQITDAEGAINRLYAKHATHVLASCQW
ncbi:Structural maintenance of chromosomes protein 3 [Elasticomyces elasticus]|nr:Structural maintenance of chromosomes protein 3 [Elasticomyces elasticus]